jgi:Rrf2 family nitric oxide-sensitive transcriptional repressor
MHLCAPGASAVRLTAFTDYSLRVLLYLAARPAGRPTIAEIARSFDIKENHLTKVVHALGRAGWLANVRGKGGGLALAQPPARIGIGDVVRRAEGEARPAECFEPGNRDCPIGRVCGLRDVLGEAVREFYKVLDSYTLADLARNRDALARVMFVETRGAPR